MELCRIFLGGQPGRGKEGKLTTRGADIGKLAGGEEKKKGSEEARKVFMEGIKEIVGRGN